MKKFTLGVVAGMSSLALAVPVIAQVAGAASGDEIDVDSLPIASQECTQAMADMASAHLDVFDQLQSQRKSQMEAHRDALVAAAQITDDEQRAEALKAARKDMRPDGQMQENETIMAAMEAVRTACGDTLKFAGGFGGPGFGHGHMERRMFIKGNLAENLGMTEEELRAELESGKTPEEIAEEKGVELPARPERGMRLFHHSMDEEVGE